MMQYPIGAVSRLTGLSVESLRAWERRYGVVTPTRDDRGRMYDEEDVRRLRLLRELTERGHAIGRIAALDSDALRRLAETLEDPRRPEPPAVDIDALLAHIRGFRTLVAERRLVDAALLLPPRDLVFRLVIPVLQRVGEDWCAGRITIAEEHALSTLIQGVLHSVLRQHADPSAPVRLVFAQGPAEHHGIGVQCAALLAAAARFGVVHLGTDTPVAEIARAANAVQATAVVLGVAHDPTAKSAARQIEQLAAALPTTDLWLGGPAREHLKLTPRMVHIPTLDDFQRELSRRGALDRLF